MTGTMFDDETLMAYADGELDSETVARIDAAIEQNEALAERLAIFIDTRAGVRDGMRPLLDEPVPAALTASVQAMIDAKRKARAEPGNVLTFGRPTEPAKRSVAGQPNRWLLPLAASIAAVLGGIAGFGVAGSGQGDGDSAQPAGVIVAGISSPQVTAALAEVRSGEQRMLEPNGRRFRAIASFRNPDSSICREFEIDSPDGATVISVACRVDDAWTVAFAVAAPAAAEGYAPASSTETLDAYLGAIGAGAPLEPADEAATLQALGRE